MRLRVSIPQRETHNVLANTTTSLESADELSTEASTLEELASSSVDELLLRLILLDNQC